MEYAYVFSLALIFGGMMAFQLLFAPLLFIKLEMAIARKFIRAFFPFYYLYFGFLTVLACGASYSLNYNLATVTLFTCTLGFLVSRQILMPMANAATDAANKARFDLSHRLTVLINTVQLIAVTYLLCMVIQQIK